jgi:hypothetical protein
MMETEKLIYDFIDGSLSSTEEEQLFIALSSSDEMRTELKQQMAIKNAVASDTKAFTPRAGSEAAIFGALGFGAATATASAATAATTTSGAATGSASAVSFWSKYSQGFFGGLVASVATVIIMLSVNELFESDSSGIAEKNSGKSIPIVTSESMDNKNSEDIATGNDFAKNNLLSTNSMSNNTLAESIQKGTNDAISSGFYFAEFILAESHVKYQKTINFDKEISYSQNAINEYMPAFAYANIPSASVFPVNRNRSYNEHNLMLELNGSGFYSDINGEMQPSEIQMLNNFGAGIWYRASDEIKFGINYKRENYYQKFIGIDINGKVWEYEQQPNFQTFTLDFRYTPEYLKYSIFSPLMQLSVGGNEAGPVGRAMIGTELKINPYLNIVAGLNYNVLAYQHQSRLFTTGKYGIYLGTGVNF